MAAALGRFQAPAANSHPKAPGRRPAGCPAALAAEIAVRGFTVGDLLSLEVGSLVDTGVSTEADVAVRVNGARVGCGKLDLLGGTPRRARHRTADERP